LTGSEKERLYGAERFHILREVSGHSWTADVVARGGVEQPDKFLRRAAFSPKARSLTENQGKER